MRVPRQAQPWDREGFSLPGTLQRLQGWLCSCPGTSPDPTPPETRRDPWQGPTELSHPPPGHRDILEKQHSPSPAALHPTGSAPPQDSEAQPISILPLKVPSFPLPRAELSLGQLWAAGKSIPAEPCPWD